MKYSETLMGQSMNIAFPMELTTKIQFHRKVTEWLGISNEIVNRHANIIGKL
jgi:hypothetical protein